MNSDDDRLKALDQSLAALPKEIEPQRDLWPGIESKIGPGAGWRELGLAAAVCLALGAGALLWFYNQQIRSDDGMNLQAVETTPSAGGDVGAATTRPGISESELTAWPAQAGPRARLVSYPGERYSQTRERELATLRAQIAQLSPTDRELIERNLAAIRDALEEIDAALSANPDNSLLKELLLATYRQELQTISSVNRITSSLRTDI